MEIVPITLVIMGLSFWAGVVIAEIGLETNCQAYHITYLGDKLLIFGDFMKHLNCTKTLDMLLSLLALISLWFFTDPFQPANAVECNPTLQVGTHNCLPTSGYTTWDSSTKGAMLMPLYPELTLTLPVYSTLTKILAIPRVCVVNEECYTDVEVTGFTVLKATQEPTR